MSDPASPRHDPRPSLGPLNRRRARSAAVPAIDALEPRALLSASLAADGTLLVAGGDGPDQVTLRRSATDPNLLQVQEGSTSLFVFLLDRVRAVSIDLGGGDDVLNLDTTPGLVTGFFGGAPGEMDIAVTGGAGVDSLLVFGAPAGGPVHQVITLGPDAGSGAHVSHAGDPDGPAQALKFTGIESAADTSITASLTVVGNDGVNVVELTGGPLAGGITPTGTVRFHDATPASAAPQNAAAAPATDAPAPAAATPATAAVDPADPASRREARRLAKQAKLDAKRRAKAAKLEARRLAREQKRAEKLARDGAAAPAAAAAAPTETLVLDRTHTAVHFANKAAVTLDARGGNDRFDVNVAGEAPAGVLALTLDGGPGADWLAARLLPPGVTTDAPNVEATTGVRDFVLSPADGPAGETPVPPIEPPIPGGPPPAPAGSAATSSRDRDDGNDASSSPGASASRDTDSSGSTDRDVTHSDDNGEEDDGPSGDANASNDD